jgi:hypothetical protein
MFHGISLGDWRGIQSCPVQGRPSEHDLETVGAIQEELSSRLLFCSDFKLSRRKGGILADNIPQSYNSCILGVC